MCGEHGMFQTFPNMTPGSSPHVRGAHFWCVGGIHYEGIIPACAGSTCVCRGRRGPNRDHPRMCGEHLTTPRQCGKSTGSSPHVRGAPQDYVSRYGHRGIIPACAGSTRLQRYQRGRCRDHPRMCGEHALLKNQSKPGVGSSPHVRGARFVPE